MQVRTLPGELRMSGFRIHSHAQLSSCGHLGTPETAKLLHSTPACVCVYHLNRCKTSFWFSLICRGTWHTIRDHVQRSYLIVWDTEPDQLCVPAVRISGIARGQAKNPKDEHDTCARLSQSELHVGLHQNLPQSKDVESNFVTFCLHDRRHHRRRQLLIA